MEVMIILGIETSCDETAAAIIEAAGPSEAPEFKILGSAVNSQIDIHKKYGGVFPTLAKREHIKNLPAVLEEALEKAGKKMEEIDKIAVTVGPGLEPALWTGINFAEGLSSKYNIPLIPTNHMEGHIASVLLGKTQAGFQFPAIALLISGGHTELVYMKNWSEKKVIGQTRDDAVGEAFDKVARMLGLSYPGGPEISRLAEKAINNFQSRRSDRLPDLASGFPRPMINSGDLDFSFSGLKTAVLYYVRKQESLNDEHKALIAREFEDAVVEVLIKKSLDAINLYNPKSFIIGGGVIANKKIREEFLRMGEKTGIKVLIPERPLTTDNAVMIAVAGYLAYLTDIKTELKAKGNLRVS